MRLKRLELFGFKSFGKKAVLEFTSQITSVVGPNGSGKSNVAEGIRFVLGEQSMKSMRGKRGEDLIFNGSQSTSRANRANVTIVFDNSKREFPLDFHEVSIAREVYRDGTNQYFINGSQVRLKDVFELLASVHIGASGHHMISQGEADRILNANPKERREMLEDALGLKVYQYKRAESERRLEKTEQNMKEAEALRREIAPHLRFLKKQVEKINEGRELRERLIGLYRVYLKREEIYCEFKTSDIADRKHVPASELADLNLKIEHARNELAKESAGDEKSQRLLDVESKLRGARARHDELSRTLGRVEGMIEFEEKQLRKKQESFAHQEDVPIRLGDVEGLQSTIEQELANANDSDDIGYIKGALGRIKDAVRGFIAHHKAEAGQKTLTDADYLEVHVLREEKGKVDEALRGVAEESKVMEAEYQAVKSEIDQEKEHSRDTERALFEMMSRRGELQATLDRMRNEEENLARESRRLEEELNEAGILLGRAVLDFSNVQVSVEEVRGESRDAQETRRREIERGKIRLEDIGELNVKLDTEFKSGVKKINHQFGDFFRLMFGGGVAELFIVKIEKRKRRDTDLDLSDVPGDEDSEEEEENDEEGIDIAVSLPHKKIKGLQMLSGGERALTSIALLFAISQVNPPPFMVLDETDAALDEANSRKYGDMIENLAKLSQLMVITHNRETMSRAGVLYGVTMGTDAVSKVLSIAFEEAQEVAK
ncbi:MAG: Chromosome partition protein smc [Parcubacteria group bacterium GW2011_GWA2_47_7]|nr:MAG: Chromosome partition protein smc [Parcubacteria group bacterium GW2011_GWA2_47_7]